MEPYRWRKGCRSWPDNFAGLGLQPSKLEHWVVGCQVETPTDTRHRWQVNSSFEALGRTQTLKYPGTHCLLCSNTWTVLAIEDKGPNLYKSDTSHTIPGYSQEQTSCLLNQPHSWKPWKTRKTSLLKDQKALLLIQDLFSPSTYLLIINTQNT